MVDTARRTALEDRQFAAGDVADVDVGFDRHAAAVERDAASLADVDGRAGNDLEELLPGAVDVRRADG